ncbi:AMP_1a_G0052770.mRNA.1.CDS.1 [Saccharomyces cerevisiae]|nr:AMP_1a_G0052770.mRNA.1.CDS.1 [Saccharomyces cerevisiae]CAI6897231.1 AMP_1a_G0052770.mRNA.1.CDS.1 [Saccharomyces cerevisiae]
MVKLTSIAAGVAAIAAGVAAAPATTTLSPSDERVNLVELGVYVSDIRAHLAQYYLFQAAHPTETYPVEIAEAVFNYGDFTTMLTGIPAEQVTRVITGVPWYSTRLRPAISVLYLRTVSTLLFQNRERSFYERNSIDIKK